MSRPPPPGIYVPAIVFYDKNEDLDLDAIRQHVLRLAQGGVVGIVVQGSIGEASLLSRDERKSIISLTRQTLDENGFQNVVLIAGCGAPSARECKLLCTDAKEAGAGYVIVLTPSTWPPLMSRDVILSFHREVASHSPLPYLIYNFPVVTSGINLDSDILLELSNHPNIVGTKLSCGSIGKLHRLTIAKPSSEFATFASSSDALLQSLVSNCAGGITGLPNIVPKLHIKMYKLCQENKIQEAMQLQELLGPGEHAFRKVGGISAMKALVAKHWGYGERYVRSPLQVATDQQFSGPHLDLLEQLVAMEKAL